MNGLRRVALTLNHQFVLHDWVLGPAAWNEAVEAVVGQCFRALLQRGRIVRLVLVLDEVGLRQALGLG